MGEERDLGMQLTLGTQHIAGQPSTQANVICIMSSRHTPEVVGDADGQTRCRHYASSLDVIAIQMHCCRKFYSCISCHAEEADHDPTVWPKALFSEAAVMCGVCRQRMSIEAYLACGSKCPNSACNAPLNPKCSLHYPLYFSQG